MDRIIPHKFQRKIVGTINEGSEFRLDYSNEMMIRDIETINKNHEQICKVFKEDIDKGTDLGCEISVDILHESNEWKRIYEKYNK